MVDGDGCGVGCEEEVALDQAVIEGESMGGLGAEDPGFLVGRREQPIVQGGFWGWWELAGGIDELGIQQGGGEEQQGENDLAEVAVHGGSQA